MSWQGNECFVGGIEYEHDDCHGGMLDAMDELLWLYGEHGNGWYLLGDLFGDDDEDDYDEQPRWDRGWDFAWLPNPFMSPGVLAIRVGCPHDLLELAFECWDSWYSAIAYAGDGDEPLERMTVYGETYDMRPSRMAAA